MERCVTIYLDNPNCVAEHNFDEKPFLLFEGEIVDTGFDVVPPDGYKLPKKFPNCCKWHRSLLASYCDWFNRFPNCCETHKELSQKIWFNKAAFNGLPLKIIVSLSYTAYFLTKSIDKSNWQEEAENYIEYVMASFGSPALGSNLFLSHLKHYIKNAKPRFADKEKRAFILDYISNYNKPRSSEPIDLNVLYEAFQKWVKSLPDLVIFSAFKAKHTHKLPSEVFLHSGRHNPYLGETKFKVRTRKQLIKLLTDTTKEALDKVDTSFFLQNGTISDVAKHQLDMAGSKRNLKQGELLGRYSKGELEYVATMRQWLEIEEEYFSSVSILLSASNVLPHLPRTNSLSSASVQNQFDLGDNSTVQIVQGNNGTQTIIRED